MSQAFNLRGDVTVNSQNAQTQLKALREEVKRVKTALQGVAGQTHTLKVKVDATGLSTSITRAARQGLTAAQTLLNGRSLKVRVELNSAGLRASVNRAVSGVGSRAVRVAVDTRLAPGAVERLRTQVRAIPPIPVRIRFDATAVRGSIQELLTITRRLTQAIEVLNRALRRTAATGRLLRQMGINANGAAAGMNGLRSSSLGAIGAMMGFYGVHLLFVALKSAFIDFNAKQQQTLTGFQTNLNGSASAAQGLYRDLQKINDLSPFRQEDIFPAANKFLAVKMSVNEVKDAMRGMSEQTSALAGDGQKFQQIGTALTQIFIKPKLQLEELTQQLIEHGVPAFDLLATAYNTNTGQIQKWITKGMIPGKEAARALWNQMERQNFGAAAKQAKTYTGALSTLSDVLKRELAAAFKPSFDALTRWLLKWATVAQNKDFQKWLRGVVSGLLDLGQRVLPFVAAGVVFLGGRFLWLSALNAAAMIGPIIAQIMLLPAPLLAAGAAVGAFVLAYKQIDQVKDATDGVVNWVVDGFKWMTRTVASAMDVIARAIGFIINKVPENIRKKFGIEGTVDLTGFTDSNENMLSDIDKWGSGVRQKVTENLNFKSVGEFFKNQLASLTGFDMAKWSKGMAGAAPKMPELYKPKLFGPDADKAALERQKALLKLQKDQLSDVATYYDAVAKSAEDSARRQIDALKGVQGTLRGMFEDMQKRFLDAGIINNPLGALITNLEKKLKFGDRQFSVASRANTVAANARNTANAARSQLETMNGGDGEVPVAPGMIQNAGGAVAGALVRSVAKAVSLPGNISSCAYAAGAILKGIGKQIPRSNIAKDLYTNARKAGWQQVPTSQMQAGDLVTWRGGKYGSMKFREGGESVGYHSMVADSNATVSGSNGRSQRIGQGMYDREHATVLRAPGGVGANGGAAQLASPETVRQQKLYGVKPTIENLFGGEMFSNSLSDLSAVPKDWGGAVLNREDSGARFWGQTQLASKEFQAALRASGMSIKEFRDTLNTIDFTLSRVAQTQAARQATGDAARQKSLIGLNPLQVLEKEFDTGGQYANADAKEKGDLRNAQRDLMLDQGAQDTKEQVNAQLEQQRVLAAGAPFLKEATFNSFAYARATEEMGEKTRVYSELAKQGYAVGSREMQEEATVRLEASRQTRDLNDQRAREINLLNDLSGLKERASLLNNEADLLKNSVLNERQLSEALDDETQRRAALKSLMEGGWSHDDATEIARETGAISARNRELERRNGIAREYKSLRAENQNAIGLSGIEAGLYRTQSAGTPELARSLAIAREQAKLQSEVQSGKLDENDVPQRVEDFWRRYDAQAKTDAAERDGQNLQSAKNALLQSQVGLAEKYLETQHQLTDLAKQEMQWSVEDIARKDAGIAITAEELKLRDQIRGVMRETARLSKDSMMSSLDDQIQLARMMPGRARDRWARDRDLKRDPNLSDDDRAGIMSREDVLAKLGDLQSIAQSSIDGIKGVFDQGIAGIAQNGMSSFGNMFDGILNQLDQFAQRMLQNAIWNQLEGLFTNLIGGALGGGGGGAAPAGWHAPMALPGYFSGLERVPSDNYVARLHANEMVLTASQAEAFRSGNTGRGSGAAPMVVTNNYNGPISIKANNTKQFEEELPGTKVGSREQAKRARMSLSF